MFYSNKRVAFKDPFRGYLGTEENDNTFCSLESKKILEHYYSL